MGLFEAFEKLINEHGSAAILREQLGLLKAQQAALEGRNSDLQTQLQAAQLEVKQAGVHLAEAQKTLEALRGGAYAKYVCDHCASPVLIRVGNRPDSLFGRAGVKVSVFRCQACQQQSCFTQDH